MYLKKIPFQLLFAKWEPFCRWASVLGDLFHFMEQGHKVEIKNTEKTLYGRQCPSYCLISKCKKYISVSVVDSLTHWGRDKMAAIFSDDILKWIFLNENVWISINISLKFFPRGPINNIPTLVQVMAWHRPGDKPLSVPMMVRLPTHICVTRPQWVKVCRCHIMYVVCIISSGNGLSPCKIYVIYVLIYITISSV